MKDVKELWIKYKKGLILGAVIMFLVCAGIFFFTDIKKLEKSFADFDTQYIYYIALLAPVNYVLRFIKWDYYLKQVKVKLSVKQNTMIFLSGLSLAMTPGKLGEFLKAYFIYNINGTSVSVTAPVVLAERITDGISMLLLCIIGSVSLRHGQGWLAFAALFLTVVVYFFRDPELFEKIAQYLARFKIFKKLSESILSFYRNTFLLFGWQSLVFAVMIGIVAWGFEGLIAWFALKGLGVNIPLLEAIFMVSFSHIVGAIVALPGGLGGAEASIFGFLTLIGVQTEQAVAAMLVTRLVNLWLGVGVGSIGLLFGAKYLLKDSSDIDDKPTLNHT